MVGLEKYGTSYEAGGYLCKVSASLILWVIIGNRVKFVLKEDLCKAALFLMRN